MAVFYDNLEANVLVEGVLSTDAADILELQRLFAQCRSEAFSFTPNKAWLKRYRIDHRRDRNAQRKYGIKTPAFEEGNFGPNWLQKADWQTYYQEVTKGIKRHHRNAQSFYRVFDAAAQRLSLPWKKHYFDDPEIRRIIGGVSPYGALGHVFAADSFGHLVKDPEGSRGTFVSAVNQIAKLNFPIVWGELESRLRKLVGLGNTMKVWGGVDPDFETTS
jgi:hypothetical protein